MNKEIRTFSGAEYRIEENEEGDKFISGYAFKFNRDSRDMGFIENIAPGAVTDATDMGDIIALFNHNQDRILARKNANVATLEVNVDAVGLHYRFKVDDEISYIRDLKRLVEKGEVSESSFAFTVAEDGENWERRADGKYVRTITAFRGIYDVSVVTKGAYADTKVDVRQLAGQEPEQEIEEVKDTDLREYQARYISLIAAN